MAASIRKTSAVRNAVLKPRPKARPEHAAGATAGPAARGGRSQPPTDVWQARIGTDLAAKLLQDAEVLGLGSKTDIVKAALELLHRHAAELRMARGVDEHYGDDPVPLPAGVVPLDQSELDEDPGE